MIAELIFAASFAFGVAGQIYDTTLTTRGLKAGVAVEGNTWLVGSHPTAAALYLRDGTMLMVLSLPAVLALGFDSTPLAIGFSAAPVVLGVKHIMGGRMWAALLRKK